MPLPVDTPPPVGPRGLALRVSVQGADAQGAGKSVLACPYGPDRPYSRRAWVAGYVTAARRAGVPLPGSLELDEELDDDAPWPGDA